MGYSDRCKEEECSCIKENKGLKILPAEDGFYMPGEYEPHKGTIMIWPERPGSWAYGARDARKAFAKIAETIAEGEDVYMLAGPSSMESAKEALE